MQWEKEEKEEFIHVLIKFYAVLEECMLVEENLRKILLQKLPITVGKMAGAVDLVLNDQSVSRLHARISNSIPPRVLWVRSLLLLPADAFFRYCPGVQPLC